MRSHVRFGSLIVSLAIGGILSGCFSSTKEVETVPAPAPVVQVPPPIVQVPAPVVVAPASDASETTTSTNWSNGAVEQKRTTRICGRSSTKPDYDYLEQWDSVVRDDNNDYH